MALERHVVEEEHILAEYRNLAGMLKEGPAGLLVHFIFTDEDYHHFLLREMAKRLREPPEWEATTAIEGASQAELQNLVKGLIKHEETTVDECRRLKTQIATEETELFDALLDALISDSGKHQRLLLTLENTVKV
jgi:hypothetical protein